MPRRAMRWGISLALLIAAFSAQGALARDGFRPRQFRAEYKEILTQYAGGDLAEALASLTQLESDIVANADSQVLDKLSRAKITVAQGLASADPEVLGPIANLHLEAYLLYLEQELPELAVHSRSLTMQLAEVLADYRRRRDLTERASRILTSLAAYMQDNFMELSAAQLFLRALEIDPANTAALLGLAALRERHGDYPEAVPLLQRLLDADPDSAEGRLRLGVNLVRLDRLEEAELIFEGLLNSTAPDWILAVGYEELARILAQSGRIDEARTLLEVAMGRLPDDATLPILSAYLADRQQPASEDDSLELALISRSAAPSLSPRYRYSQKPKRSIQQMRLLMLAETNQELPRLRRALNFD